MAADRPSSKEILPLERSYGQETAAKKPPFLRTSRGITEAEGPLAICAVITFRVIRAVVLLSVAYLSTNHPGLTEALTALVERW